MRLFKQVGKIRIWGLNTNFFEEFGKIRIKLGKFRFEMLFFQELDEIRIKLDNFGCELLFFQENLRKFP